MHILGCRLQSCLAGALAIRGAIALPGPPAKGQCTITDYTDVTTTSYWAWWTKTCTSTVTLTAAPGTVTVTDSSTNILYQTMYSPTTITLTSNSLVSATMITGTTTSTITSTATTVVSYTDTTTAIITPSPALDSGSPPDPMDKRALQTEDCNKTQSCKTVHATNTHTWWWWTIAHTTKTQTMTQTLPSVTRTSYVTASVTQTISLPTTATATATDVSTTTIGAVSTVMTTTTATVPTTTTLIPTYSVMWNQDACGYHTGHIADDEMSGDEQDVINQCANLCSQTSNCVLWEAYYDQSTGRCATFDAPYDATLLGCNDDPNVTWYSVGAQLVEN